MDAFQERIGNDDSLRYDLLCGPVALLRTGVNLTRATELLVLIPTTSMRVYLKHYFVSTDTGSLNQTQCYRDTLREDLMGGYLKHEYAAKA